MKYLFYIMLLLLTSNVFAFDPPTCGDPWYYQSNDRGFTFMIPDKVQHYYGSYLLTEITSKYLGNTLGSLAAFTCGFLWEVKDSETVLETKGVVGFSYRDLIADGLGVITSKINKNPNSRMFMTYDTLNKTIMLNAAWVF